jgi:hypothetical protein
MAKQTKSRQSRSGDSRKSGQRQKKGVGSKKGGSNSSDDGGNMSKAAEAQTGGKPMGRAPVEEPDVWVNVPELHVGELNIDVGHLDAQLALRTHVASLVGLIAGVQVSVDNVKIDLKDVDGKAELKVRLQNTYNILDRTLTTLDENPEILKGLLETADTAGKEATRPGGAVKELTSGVGDTIGNVGNTFSSVAKKASPKKLTSGDGSKASGGDSSGSGLGKDAAAAGAVGAAGLLGGVLLGLRRRNGLSGFFRRNGLRSMAKQLGKPRKLNKARKTVDQVLP